MGPARIGFLSLLILSLGVAILFGDGESYDQVCFFDAVPASEDEISYNVSLPHVFHGLSFGQDGPQDVLDEDPTVKIFDKEWWVSEMAIIMYEMAQELLAYNLVAAGYLGLKTTLTLMVVNSCIFLLCCWSLYWGGLVWANLWESWFIGFIIAIMFTPIFNAMSYGLAKCIVKCGCLSEPECEDQAGSQTKSSQQKQDPSATSVLQKNDDQDDSAEEKEFFKVVVPEGMQPGQQLKVHMGSASVASPLVVIPNREFWMSETIANTNEESALQNFFYVETPKTADSKKEVSL